MNPFPAFDGSARAVPVSSEQALQLDPPPRHLQAARWVSQARGENEFIIPGQPWLIGEREQAFHLFAMAAPWTVVGGERLQSALAELTRPPAVIAAGEVHPALAAGWSASPQAARMLLEPLNACIRPEPMSAGEALAACPALAGHLEWFQECHVTYSPL